MSPDRAIMMPIRMNPSLYVPNASNMNPKNSKSDKNVKSGEILKEVVFAFVRGHVCHMIRFNGLQFKQLNLK